MKRHFDLTRTLKNSQLALLGVYDAWLNVSDYAQLITEGRGSTIFYLLGEKENNKTIDTQFPGRFSTRARVIIASVGENEIINCDVLSDEDDQIDKGDSIILVTGCENSNQQHSESDKLPVLGNDFAEWLVRKNIGMFITDLPALANAYYLPEFEELHDILIKGNISVVTGINKTNVLFPGVVNVTAIPMKIEGGNWSFVRVIISYD